MTKPTEDFGKRLAELEAITNWFETGEPDLDQALTKFERGMQLVTELKADLQTTYNKVEKIKQRFDKPPAAEVPADTAEPDLFS